MASERKVWGQNRHLDWLFCVYEQTAFLVQARAALRAMKFSLQRRQFQALQRDLDLVDAEKTSVYRKRVDGVQLRPYHPLSSLFVTCLILFALSCLWLFRRRRSKAVSYGPPAAERPTTLSSPHAVRVWVAARCIHSLGQHSGAIW